MSNTHGLPIATDTPRVSKFELLRFVAAIMILLWHYQHFYTFETGTFDRKSQPFYGELYLAFNYGNLGVQLFWMLSGLIFGLVYSDKIFNREITLRDFWLKRFARLYPLHLATLVIVALLQASLLRNTGKFFIYTSNSATDFLAQLLLASNWLPDSSFTFNGPIWSISLEILVYAVFFVTFLIMKPSLAHSGLLALGTIFFANFGPQAQLLDAFAFFFAGIFTYNLIEALKKVALVWRILTFTLLSLSAVLLIASKTRMGEIQDAKFGVFALTLIFGTLLLGVGLAPDLRGRASKVANYLGSLTYSVYLIHFPIQLAFFHVFGGAAIAYVREWELTLFAFIILVLSTSAIVYWWFERPARAFILRAGRKRPASG